MALSTPLYNLFFRIAYYGVIVVVVIGVVLIVAWDSTQVDLVPKIPVSLLQAPHVNTCTSLRIDSTGDDSLYFVAIARKLIEDHEASSTIDFPLSKAELGCGRLIVAGAVSGAEHAFEATPGSHFTYAVTQTT